MHARRPSILALVIGGSLLTFILNLYISQGVPTAQQLALQWGPIPLDLSGNLAGLGFLHMFGLVAVPLRAALSAWAICLLLDLPFRFRAFVRAGLVYLGGGALVTMGLAISYAWEEALLSAESVSRLSAWLFSLLLPTLAILLTGLLTPVLVKQFMEVSIGSSYRDPRHWTMAAISYLIWSAGIYMSFFWPVAVGYGLAFVLLSIQSLIVGAILMGVVGWSELPERPATPAAAESG